MKDLAEIDKKYRTPQIIEMGLRKNGVQLRDLDEDELSQELVNIAVEQNGFVYPSVPEQYMTKEALLLAIVSTKGMVISEYMAGCDLDEDLQILVVGYECGYVYSIGNLTQAAFDHAMEREKSYMIHNFYSNANDSKEFNYTLDIRRKFLKHRHIIDYFELHKDAERSLYVEQLHRLTDNVTMELMLAIHKVAPNTYGFFKTVEGFDIALRKEIIDDVLVGLE